MLTCHFCTTPVALSFCTAQSKHLTMNDTWYSEWAAQKQSKYQTDCKYPSESTHGQWLRTPTCPKWDIQNVQIFLNSRLREIACTAVFLLLQDSNLLWPRQLLNLSKCFKSCQEALFSQAGLSFNSAHSLEGKYNHEGNITILAPPTRDISSVPVDIWYIRWSKWMISSKFDGALWLSQKFGNKTRSLRTKQSERKLDSFARFLLWRSIVNCCVLWLRGSFLSGSVS